MDRPIRRGASKAAKAEAAASKLKQLKEKGGKGRLDDIEEAEDKAVYDVVRAHTLQYVVFDDPPLVSRRSDRGGGDRDW